MVQESQKSKPIKHPTLVHVARLAQVGLGTASRVLNGERNVSQEAVASVMAAMEQLGYKPNEVARNLKVRRSGAVGIVVSDIGGPFMATCVHAIHVVLRKHGYVPVLAFSDGDSKIEAKELDYLLRRQIEGLIVVPAGLDSAHFRERFLSETPMVSFDQPIPGRNLDAVLVKNKVGARVGVEHLIEHGHKRIACIGVHKHAYTIKNRIQGYRHAMREAGLAQVVCIVEPCGDQIRAQLEAWLKLKNPPTAIFSLNELTSIGLLHALAAHKVSIPGQMALVGFDDVQLGELLRPPLTVVRQPAAELGAQAASLLVKRINASADFPIRRILLNTKLILRGSCGCNQGA